MNKEFLNRVKQCKQIIEAMGSKIENIDDEQISVDNDSWRLYLLMECLEEDMDEIYLSFNHKICPIMAANITNRLAYLTFNFGLELKIVEGYSLVYDEDGNVINSLLVKDCL